MSIPWLGLSEPGEENQVTRPLSYREYTQENPKAAKFFLKLSIGDTPLVLSKKKRLGVELQAPYIQLFSQRYIFLLPFRRLSIVSSISGAVTRLLWAQMEYSRWDIVLTPDDIGEDMPNIDPTTHHELVVHIMHAWLDEMSIDVSQSDRDAWHVILWTKIYVVTQDSVAISSDLEQEE